MALPPCWYIMAGTLYVVSTPIGNLEDITLRALRILKEADVIAAEDTRVTRKLTSHFDIHTPLISYHQHSGERKTGEILDMLGEGKNIALVSDAGTPGISDPGHELIEACIAEGIAIVPIPGPTAIIAALVTSGLPTARFSFDGFPPRKESERAAFFEGLRNDPHTICLYESPGRLVKTLKSICNILGDRRIAVVREITKVFEEVFRGPVSAAVERFDSYRVRGEIVIVIEGASPAESDEGTEREITLEERLVQLISEGFTERDAVRQVTAEFKLPKREVYSAALKLKENSEP